MAANTDINNNRLRIPEPPIRAPLTFTKERMIAPFGGAGHSGFEGAAPEEKDRIEFYNIPSEIKLLVASGIFRGWLAEDNLGDHTETITKLLTLFNCVFPVESLRLTSPIANFAQVEPPATLVSRLMGRDRQGDAPAAGDQDTRPIITDPIEHSLFGYTYSMEEWDQRECMAAFVVGAYAVVKEPNENNISAFTEKRKNALIKQLRLSPESHLMATWWKINVLTGIHGAFNVMIGARFGLIQEISGWSQAALTTKRGWAWGQMKLLERHGMVAMEAMANFVNSCDWVIVNHPVLYDEAERFILEKRKFDDMTEHARKFKKTIEGAYYTPLNLNQMQNLLGAAVAYGKVASKSFGNYRGGEMSPEVRAYVEQCLGRLNLTTNA
jgi:hypothetical protein